MINANKNRHSATFHRSRLYPRYNIKEINESIHHPYPENFVYWKSEYTLLVCNRSDQDEQQTIYITINELKSFQTLSVFISTVNNNDNKIILKLDNYSDILGMTTKSFGRYSNPINPGHNSMISKRKWCVLNQ